MAVDALGTDLEPLPPAAPPTPPVVPAAGTPANPYDSIVDDILGNGEPQLRSAILQTGDQTPDRAAAVKTLSDKTGLPADLVGRNFEEISQRATARSVPYADIVTQTPKLSTWAADPANAALAKDPEHGLDPHLGVIEWLMGMPARAISQTLNANAAGALRSQAIFRDLTQEEQDRLNAYEYHATLGASADDTWFRQAVSGSARFAAFLASGAASPAAIAGTVGGGILGTLAEPGGGTIVGAKLGFEAGNVYGLAKIAAQTGAGDAYKHNLELRDNLNQPMDPTAAKMGALAVGAINAGVMVLGAKLIEAVPGFESLTRQWAQSAVAKALQKPTLTALLVEGGKTWGAHLTGATGLMVGQQAATILADELAKDLDAHIKAGAPPDYGYGPRFESTTPKGLGFLGPLQRADGSVMTEFSIGVPINGKETQIPTLVPTLSKDQVAAVLAMKDGDPLPAGVAEAATAYAQQRLAAGKDPFAQAGEQQPNLYPELARAATPATAATGRIAAMTASDAAHQLLMTAINSARDFAIVSAVAPAIGVLGQIPNQRAAAARAAAGVASFDALGAHVAASKTFARAPDAGGDFVGRVSNDATVYAPLDTWNTYWQSKGVDPAKMAATVTGDPRAYDRATKEGADLPIPTANYASKLAGTDHNAYFKNEIRLEPDAMNGREAELFHVEQSKAAGVPAAEPGESPIATQLLARFAAAHVPEDAARAYTDELTAILTNLAEPGRATTGGMDPEALLAAYGLTITRPDASRGLQKGAKTGSATAAVIPESGPIPALPDDQAAIARATDAQPVERRVSPGGGPGGQERRVAEGLPPTGTIAERAAVLRAENPNIDVEAQAMRDAATAVGRIAAPPAEGAGATFLAHGPDGPLYNFPLADGTMTTGGAESVKAAGFDVPETPPATGERLSGDQIRQRMSATPEFQAMIAATKAKAEAWTRTLSTAFATRLGAETIGPTGVRHLVHMSTREPGRIQITSLDETGQPSGHITVDSIAQAARELTGDTIVDKNAPGAQTQGASDADSQFTESPSASRTRLAAWDGVAPSEPRSREVTGKSGRRVVQETDAQRAERETVHYATVYADLLDAARALDPKIPFDPEDVRAEFYARVGAWKDLQSRYEDSGADPRELLKAIASEGGLFEGRGGMTGEVADLKSGTKFGGIAGVAGVFRKGTTKDSGGAPIAGLGFDVMLQRLQQDGRFPWLADVNALHDFLDEVRRHPPEDARGIFPGTYDLARDVGIDPTRAWWLEDSYRPGNMLEPAGLESETVAPEGVGDTSFNVDEFSQSLFDDLKPPDATSDELTKADVNDKGEAQPRLPGDVGAVQDQNIGTPQFEAPFSLTSEIAKPTKGGQKTLFQSAFHGSAQKFEEFSMHAIGSGQGAQSFGWGLYFASQREIAERYRAELSNNADLNVEGGGRLPGWVARQIEKPLGFWKDNLITTREGVIDALLDDFKERVAEAEQKVADKVASYWNEESKLPGLREVVQGLENVKKGAAVEKPGRTYTVELPHDDDFLSWDKPASQQSPKVQAALKALGVTWDEFTPKTIPQILNWFNGPTADKLAREDIGIREALREGLHYATSGNETALRAWQEQHQGFFAKGMVDPTGETIYGQIAASRQREITIRSSVGNYGGFQADAQAASEALNREGVAGIRYLDGQSRAAGEGTSNYVVFDAKLAPITEFDQGPVALTTASLQAWADEVKQKAGPDLKAFDLYVTHAGDLHLDTIAVDRGAQRAGIGSTVMQELTRLADLNGKRITLNLADKGFSPVAGTGATTSRGRLITFYKRFGFVENAGRSRDFSISASMYREPTAPTPGAAPETVTAQPAFREWFGKSVVKDQGGAPLVVYHGTARLDRFGPEMKKGRATSGPMPFFTADRNIASRYADQKPDTSLANEDVHNFEHYFRLNTGKGAAVPLDRAWFQLTPEQRTRIAELAPRVTQDDNGTLYLADAGHTTGLGGYDQHIKEARGNHFVALIDEWLNSATLFNDERRFEDVLKLAGAPTDKIEFHDPHKDAGGVAPAYLAIERPLITGMITDSDVAALQAAAGRQRKQPAASGADFWDKTLRDPREWVRQLVEDRDKGENSFVWTSIPDWVTKTLQAQGYDGIRDVGGKMGGAEHEVWIPFEPGQVKSALGNRGTFDRSSSNILRQERRGSIRFGPDRQFNIALLERADLSTFLHESGHFFLEVLHDLSLRPDATDQIKADIATLKAEMPDAAHTGPGFSEQQHEQFARSFEAYLMEGKAPSLALQGTFAKFRAWLLGVYRSLTALHVNLTPEVRGVLDRLHASDAAIADAEARRGPPAMFTTAESAGMTPAQFELYRSTVADAHRTSVAELDRKLLADVQREQQATWKAQRAEVETAVTAETQARPEYRALAAILKGEHPNGDPLIEGEPLKPLTLSRALVGRERARRLPRGATAADGMSPTAAAELLGYPSANALLDALEHAPPMKDVIRAETTRRMIEQHGNILLDGTLADKAKGAAANADRDIVIRAEMRALGNLRRTVDPFVTEATKAGATALAGEQRERAYERRWFEAEAKLRIAIAEGKKQAEIDDLTREVQNLKRKARGGAATIRAGIPPASVLQALALERIGQMPVGQIEPAPFWSASRRASLQALERAARQDFDGAIVAKQQELLNLNLYREAETAKEEVTATLDRFTQFSRPDNKIATSRNLDMVNAARAVLGQFGLGPGAGRYEASLGLLKVYDPEAHQAIVDLIEAATPHPQNYRLMPLADFRTMADAVDALWELARTSEKITIAGKAEDIAAVRTRLLDQVHEFSPARTPVGLSKAVTSWDRAKVGLLGFRARARRIEDWVTGVDNGRAGIAHDAIYNPINEGAVRYDSARVTAAADYARIVATLDADTRHEQIAAPELGYTFTSKHVDLLGALLHTGNGFEPGSNGDKLLRGRGWATTAGADGTIDTSKWDSFIDRMQREGILTKQDYDYVQAVWNLVDSFKAGAQATHKERFGRYFDEVTRVGFDTPFGHYEGGYYPAIADPFITTLVGDRAEARALLDSGAGGSTMFPSVQKGFTQTRTTGYAKPLILDATDVLQHVNSVLRFTHLSGPVHDVARLILSPDFRGALDKVDPAATSDLLVPFLQRASSQQMFEPMQGKAGRALNSFAREIRNRGSMQIIALNATVLAEQVTHFPSVLAHPDVDVSRVLGALWDLSRAPKRTTQAMHELSPFMETRSSAGLVDAHEAINRILLDPNPAARAAAWVQDHSTVLMRGIQATMDSATWQAVFNKVAADAGTSQDEAVRRADSAVRQTLGSYRPQDRAAIEGGNHVVGLLNQFYGFFGTKLNMISTEALLASRMGLQRQFSRAFAVYTLGFMIPAMLGEGIKNSFRGDPVVGKHKDDEDAALSFLRFWGLSQLKMGARMIPFGGAAVEVAAQAFMPGKAANLLNAPSIAMVENALHAPGEAYKALTDTNTRTHAQNAKAITDFFTLLGLLSNLPMRPVGQAVNVLHDQMGAP